MAKRNNYELKELRRPQRPIPNPMPVFKTNNDLQELIFKIDNFQLLSKQQQEEAAVDTDQKTASNLHKNDIPCIYVSKLCLPQPVPINCCSLKKQ